MKSLYLAAASVLALGAPAFAADAIMPMPPVAAPMIHDAHDWSGFYAGGNIGYGWGEADVDGLGTIDEIDGILGGVQAGYNIAFDGLVVGVETDIQLANLERSEDGVVGGFPYEVEVGLDWFGTVRARAGFAAGNFMPYVTGGFAYGQGYASVTVGGAGETIDETHTGYTVGGGVEFAVTENLTLKGEYLYVDLGEQEYDGATVDADFHTIRAGVNFSF